MSHAFSETALREQEPIFNKYFDLFISRLKDQIDGSAAAKIDIKSWYNYATFDIIGLVRSGAQASRIGNAYSHTFPGTWFLGSHSNRLKTGMHINGLSESQSSAGICIF